MMSIDVNVSQIEQAVTNGKINNLNKLFSYLKNYLYKPKNSFQIPNVVILACKSNRFEILKYLLSSSAVDIVCKVNGAFYELPEEDSAQHNVFYYSIRSNNILLIDQILNYWPKKDLISHPDEFDHLLSSSYQELLLNNFLISNDMKFFVESKLLNLRFFCSSPDTEIYSYKNVKGRLCLLIDNITDLIRFTEVDEKCLYKALFVAKSIHVLKSTIKSTYTVMPWEEIEFCLSSFILLHKKSHKINFVCKHILTPARMHYHLKNVLMKLQEVNLTICSRDIAIYSNMPEKERKQIVDNIGKQFPPFKELYKDYQLIRDIYSLRLIKDAIKLAQSVDSQSKEGHLVIFRALQIMAENIKHSLDNPKLSIITGYLLLLSLSVSTRSIVIYLRDTLSPCFLRKRLETETEGDFPRIQKDLTNVSKLISNLILKRKLDILREMLKEICEIDREVRLKEILLSFKYFLFESDKIEYLQVLEDKKINIFITKLERKITSTDLYEYIILNQIKILEPNYSKEKFRIEDYIGALRFIQMLAANADRTKQLDQQSLIGLKEKAKDLVDILKCECDSSQFFMLGENILKFLKYIAKKHGEEDKEIIKIICEILPYLSLAECHSFTIQDLLKQICERNAKSIILSKKNDFYNDQARYNFYLITDELKNLLVLNDIKLELNFSFRLYMIDKKLIACLHLLLIDYMSLLDSKNELVNNILSLDVAYPLILTGQILLQQLIRNDILVDLITEDPNQTAAAALNAHSYVIATTASCKRTQVLWEHCFKPKSFYDKHLHVIVNKLLIFSALENGDLEGVKIAVNKGADLLSRNLELRTCLHFAAKASNSNVTEYILEQLVNADCKDLQGRSPLHVAAEFGRTSTVIILLKHGLNVNEEDNEFKTPLHLASMNGHTDTISVLIDKNAHLGLKDTCGMVPLHYAVKNNDRDAAALLVAGEVHVGTTMKGNITCLHLAAEEGNLDMVKYLLFKGATLNAKDLNGFEPLHNAARYGHFEIAEFLIYKGSNVNSKSLNGCAPLHLAAEFGHFSLVKLLLKHKANNSLQTINKCTPLHYASKNGHSDIVNLLLECGANAEKLDVNKSNCLHTAVFNSHKHVVKTLIQHKVDVNARCKNNISALHIAALCGSEDIINILVQSKALVNALDDFDNTPLHIAAERGNCEIVAILLNNHADINCKGNYGNTPLHCASVRNHTNVLSLLLKKKANVSVYNNELLSPLHFAVNEGAKECLALLLEKLTPEDSNEFKRTPLLNIAAQKGHKDIVEMLFLHGARDDVLDKSGNSPLLLAVVYGYYNVVELLIAKGALLESLPKFDRSNMIFYTIMSGCNDILEILLAKRLIHISDIGTNGLIIAIHFGRKDIVEVLLKNKINANSEDYEHEDFTYFAIMLDRMSKKSGDYSLLESGFIKPILFACYKKQTEIVEILLANGANANTYQANFGTPLYLAASLGYSDIVALVLSYGADINYMISSEALFEAVIAKGHLSVAELLLKHTDINFNYKNTEGRFLLHFAAESGHLEIVSFLMEKGCNINSADDYNMLPIHIAAINGYIDIIEVFLTQGIDIEEHGRSGNTLIHFAAMFGHLNVVKFLVSKKANVNAVNFNGLTPLYEAASRGNKDVAEFLLESGAFINSYQSDVFPFEGIYNLFNFTRKLFNSVKQKNLCEVVESIKSGAVINAVDDRFGTVLHYAAWKGFDEICKILLENKGNPNIPCKKGFMPLHYAAQFDHYNVVLSLLSSGAAFNVLSVSGKAPIDFATDKNIINVLQITTKCFSSVRNGDVSVLSHLKKIKDLNFLKSIMKARDKDMKTILSIAVTNKFEKINDLKGMFLGDIQFKVFTAEILSEQEKFDEALDLCKSTLEVVKFDLDDNDELVLKIEELIADIYDSKNEFFAALCQYEKLFTKIKGLLGLEHKATLKIKQLIGSVLLKMGKDKDGIALLKVVLEQQKSLDSDDLDLVQTKVLLALALPNVKKYKAAMEISTELFNKLRETKGSNDNLVLDLYANVSLCLNAIGRGEEALKICKTVYDIRVKTLGLSHPATIKSLHQLACVLLTTGKTSDAFKNFNKTLVLQESVPGCQSASIFSTKCTIAHLLKTVNNYVGALKFFNEAYDVGLKMFGPQDQKVLRIISTVESIKCALNFNSFHDMGYILKTFQRELFSYVQKGDVVHVENLLSRGVFINERDSEGRTPLHFGVSSDNVEMVTLLLEYGADVTLSSNKGNTPLHTAAIKNNNSILEVLLHNATNTDLRSYLNSKTKVGGTTALHIAAKNECFTAVKTLLEHGASYNVTNNKGETPYDVTRTEEVKHLLRDLNGFFSMVRSGDKGIIKKLEVLDHDVLKCVANARNTRGKTLVQFSIENSHLELAGQILNVIKSG